MADFLDIRTLSFITGVTALAMFLCMLHVAIRRKTYPGFYLWTAAALANTLGFMMMSLRHHLPDFGTVVLANFLIGLASVLICRGLASFSQARQLNWLDFPALAVLIALFIYFTHWQPDVRARVVVLSLFLAFFFYRAVKHTMGTAATLVGETNYLLLLSLSFAAVWLCLRGAVTWLWGTPITDFMSAGVWQGLAFVVFMICNILYTVGLISITSKRTENDLVYAREEIQSLRGFLPICAHCKKIRDDQGYWQQVESYIEERTGAEFTHGICPECMKKLYPGLSGNK